MSKLVDRIGIQAMLEQTAEEANELGFACLKLARLLRGENKVYGRSEEELIDNVEEELADIFVCASELHDSTWIDYGSVKEWVRRKRRRMNRRLREEDDAY